MNEILTRYFRIVHDIPLWMFLTLFSLRAAAQLPAFLLRRSDTGYQYTYNGSLPFYFPVLRLSASGSWHRCHLHRSHNGRPPYVPDRNFSKIVQSAHFTLHPVLSQLRNIIFIPRNGICTLTTAVKSHCKEEFRLFMSAPLPSLHQVMTAAQLSGKSRTVKPHSTTRPPLSRAYIRK